MKAVEWRNSVTHKTGHLPANLLDQTVEHGISKILDLTALLARKANQIAAAPEIREIANFLHEKHGISTPSIWVFPKHRLFAEFTIFGPPLHEFPNLDRLNAVVSDLIIKRLEQDPRFVPQEHLFISFFEFPKQPRARWYKGKIESTGDTEFP